MMYIKNGAEFINEYTLLGKEKEYWLNFNPISDHEAKTKKYRLNEVERRINELIKDYPKYAKDYYLI